MTSHPPSRLWPSAAHRKCSTSSWTRTNWRTPVSTSPNTSRPTGRQPIPPWRRPWTPCWGATWAPPPWPPTPPASLGCRYTVTLLSTRCFSPVSEGKMKKILELTAVLRVSVWLPEPKNPPEQQHGRPFHPERAAQPDDIGRKLPQRAGAQGTQPHVLWLSAQPGPAGPLPGLPGPLSGCIQATPQPQLTGQLQPWLPAPALSPRPQPPPPPRNPTAPNLENKQSQDNPKLYLWFCFGLITFVHLANFIFSLQGCVNRAAGGGGGGPWPISGTSSPVVPGRVPGALLGLNQHTQLGRRAARVEQPAVRRWRCAGL